MTKSICLVTTIAVTLGALCLLTGCGGGHQAARPVAASSRVAHAAEDTGPGSIPVVQTAREGHVFRLSYEQNDVPTSWQIALFSVTCGDGTIFSAKVLAAAAKSTGQSAPATPKPDQGQQFCLARYGVTNDSTSDQPWSASDTTLNVGMDAYQTEQSGLGSDVEQDYLQEAEPASDTSDFGINPGVSAVSWAVFQIPTHAKVTSASVPAGGTTLDSTQVVITAAAKPTADQTTAARATASPTAAPQPSDGCDDSCGESEPVIFNAGSYNGIRPTTIGFSGDSGNIVSGINWSSWGAETAIGYGTIGINNCVPDCAEGAVKYVPATITLSNPISGTPTLWGTIVEQDNGLTTTYSYPDNWPLGAEGGYLPTASGG